jgi:nucleoid DNA-binding protein|tara:strand:- start:108 stop:389 length:282 start_codon:yes stop_codon:yes gene_type:complete
LSRPEFIKKLKQKNPKINNSEIEIIIDTFCVNIQNALTSGMNVELRGFGTFFVKEVKEKYSARNPKTKELIYVPKKNKVRFRASKNLKKIIND